MITMSNYTPISKLYINSKGNILVSLAKCPCCGNTTDYSMHVVSDPIEFNIEETNLINPVRGANYSSAFCVRRKNSSYPEYEIYIRCAHCGHQTSHHEFYNKYVCKELLRMWLIRCNELGISIYVDRQEATYDEATDTVHCKDVDDNDRTINIADVDCNSIYWPVPCELSLCFIKVNNVSTSIKTSKAIYLKNILEREPS